MNDSPGWATPGSSPSDGGQGAEGAGGTQPPTQPAQPAGDPKWSAEQPPPGQWSSPGSSSETPGAGATSPTTPPRPQQGAGWGSYGGQQGGQQGSQYAGQYGYPGGPGAHWGKPAAAKPGVIPLRPLGVGEILDGAVATMRKHWRSVLPITLVVATVVQLFSLLTQKYALSEFDVSSQPTTMTEAFDTLSGSLLASGADLFIQLVGSIVATAMLTMIFSRAVLGNASSIGAAWRDARPQLPRLLGLTLILMLGAILLIGVLVLPGILLGSYGLGLLGVFAGLGMVVWLWTALSLSSPALMLEKASVSKALARSWKLVRGSWWRIFGITALTQLITAFLSGIIVFPLTALGLALFGGDIGALADGTGEAGWGYLILTAIGVVIALTITMPMQSGVTVLLYVDQRIRREALDLELARAAGLENHGANHGTAATPPPAGAGG
ncbi:hypothetical protein ACFWBF_12795 [Streptomyces sp. NPDC060028]|uniref:hypothetical protein n=1 Tax=Streptomyces sp. NPDC060028 TaxID=3347041 RepID=UPI0036BE1BFB